MDRAKGVDISVYQHFRLANGHPDLSRPVDFAKMKAQGVSFAYVRATTIEGEPDYAFEENWAGLKEVGIPRGAYGFANQNYPVGYAERMHQIVQATNDLGELPPALDFECRYIAATKSYIGKMTWQACHDWLQHVEALWERKPIIYTSLSMWFHSPPPWTADYKLWVANYEVSTPKLPAGWSEWTFWQTGTLAVGLAHGVKSKELDMDVFNGDENKLAEVFGLVHKPTIEERLTDLERRVTNLEGR